MKRLVCRWNEHQCNASNILQALCAVPGADTNKIAAEDGGGSISHLKNLLRQSRAQRKLDILTQVREELQRQLDRRKLCIRAHLFDGDVI